MEDDDKIAVALGRYVQTSSTIAAEVAKVSVELSKMRAELSQFMQAVSGQVLTMKDSIETLTEAMEELKTSGSSNASVLGSYSGTSVMGTASATKRLKITSKRAVSVLVYSMLQASLTENTIPYASVDRKLFNSLVTELLDYNVGMDAITLVPSTNSYMVVLRTATNDFDNEDGPMKYMTPAQTRELLSKVGPNIGLAISLLIKRLRLCRHLLPYNMMKGLCYIGESSGAEYNLTYNASVITSAEDEDICDLGRKLAARAIGVYVSKVLGAPGTYSDRAVIKAELSNLQIVGGS